MSTLEELEKEAAQAWNQLDPGLIDPYEDIWETEREAWVAGHVRAKTISAELAEKATRARLLKRGYNSRHSIPAHDFAYEVAETIEGFRTAGFHVEGEEQ